jgi:hypothetical protein
VVPQPIDENTPCVVVNALAVHPDYKFTLHVSPSDNYLFKRKGFGLCWYWPRNAELVASALNMPQD